MIGWDGARSFFAAHTRAVVLALAGFLLTGAAVAGFAALAEEVFEGETSRLDHAVLQWFGAHRTPLADSLALEITALGNAATLIVLVLLACALLWIGAHKRSVLLLAVALGTGLLVGVLLKEIFPRDRPTLITWLAHPSSSSFPSGHALNAAVAYGSVAYLVGRLAKARLRSLVWLVASLLVVAIGVSRVYVGVHYPSDVLAGWLGGIGWALVLAGITRPIRRRGSPPRTRGPGTG